MLNNVASEAAEKSWPGKPFIPALGLLSTQPHLVPPAPKFLFICNILALGMPAEDGEGASVWLPSEKVKGTMPFAAPWAANSLEQAWAGACMGIQTGVHLGSVPVGALDSGQSLDWGWGCMEETTAQGLGAPRPCLCLRGLLAALRGLSRN